MDNKILTIIIMAIIGIVIIFNIVGNSATTIIDSADSITDANNCTEDKVTDTNSVALFYNYSDKYCYNVSPGSDGGKQYLAGQYDLPINTLFGRSSVALLVFMGMLLLVIIGVALAIGKIKKP